MNPLSEFTPSFLRAFRPRPIKPSIAELLDHAETPTDLQAIRAEAGKHYQGASARTKRRWDRIVRLKLHAFAAAELAAIREVK